MDRSPLAKLPVEIRLMIYKLAFKQAAFMEVSHQGARTIPLEYGSEDKKERKNERAITLVCKEIRSEALSAYYSLHHLIIDVNLPQRHRKMIHRIDSEGNSTFAPGDTVQHIFRIVPRWLAFIGRDCVQSFRSVKVSIGWLDKQTLEDFFSKTLADELAYILRIYIWYRRTITLRFGLDYGPRTRGDWAGGALTSGGWATNGINLPLWNFAEGRRVVDDTFLSERRIVERHLARSVWGPPHHRYEERLGWLNDCHTKTQSFVTSLERMYGDLAA